MVKVLPANLETTPTPITPVVFTPKLTALTPKPLVSSENQSSTITIKVEFSGVTSYESVVSEDDSQHSSLDTTS